MKMEAQTRPKMSPSRVPVTVTSIMVWTSEVKVIQQHQHPVVAQQRLQDGSVRGPFKADLRKTDKTKTGDG